MKSTRSTFISFLILLVSSLAFLSPTQAQQNLWQNKIINEISSTFEFFFQTLDLPFRIESRWEDPSSVGGAINNGDAYLVTLHGGLLQNQKLDEDTLRITICHEMGHHFGGAPRRSAPMEWHGPLGDNGLMLSSSEGEADYYTTATCFRKLVRGQNHRIALSHSSIDETLNARCAEVWGKDTEDHFICLRGALGGLKLLNLNFDFPISFSSPSTEVAREIVRDIYPSRQCRLDTYVAGALCKHDLPLSFSADEAAPTQCANRQGQRPTCWFPAKESK